MAFPPSPYSLYSTGWNGLTTLMDNKLFHGKHSKMRGRPHIHTTRLGVFAEARDEDQKNTNHNYLGMGDWIREVYYSNLQFGGNEDDWQFDRILGAGTFGMVASWIKYLEGGGTDSLVTKSETPGTTTAAHLLRPDVSREAFILTQLNTRQCMDGWPHMGVVQLRGYRYIHGDTSTQGLGFAFQPKPGHLERPFYREWRTYMENCNYGNISRVMLTYKAWGYHVPEAFVWWTFFWLLQGCRALSADAGEDFLLWTEAHTTNPLEDSWVLANDIKSENCFYGSERSNHGAGVPFDQYPAARVGDFGLAQVVKLDSGNRRRYLHAGTPVWTAPEKRKIKLTHDANGKRICPFYHPQRVDSPSFKRTDGVPASGESHCIGPEANMWTVGVIIYVLMTGENIREISNRVNWMLRPENATRDNPAVPKYLCQPEDFPGFLSGDEDYSPELKNLVAEVCRLEPLKRPSLEAAVSEVSDGIKRERARLVEAFGDDAAIYDATRMAFTNEQWHDVPHGPFVMLQRPTPGDMDRGIGQLWYDFTHHVESWQDPNGPPLFPPGRTSDKLPPGMPDQERPFLGSDMVTYVNPGATASYWKGRPLPKGGRAQPPRNRAAHSMEGDPMQM